MTRSINQPWSISDKFAAKYGDTWTKLDFEFEDKISAENFQEDPMNCSIGTLKCAGQTIHMSYKDLVSYSKALETYTNNMYGMRPTKTDVFAVDVKGRTLMLVKHEVAKLNDTINEAYSTCNRAYELGLFN
jgi:hypothetical protein